MNPLERRVEQRELEADPPLAYVVSADPEAEQRLCDAVAAGKRVVLIETDCVAAFDR